MISDLNVTYETAKAEDIRSGDLEALYYFEERKLVGAGTYGYFCIFYCNSKVYKVLSKLDGKFYAVKEIKVLHDKEGVCILFEM